jgi:outer membrane protein assembly factor BamB
VGPQAQAHVACLEVETGRLRWRTFVCAAETPAHGMLHQASHNLLSLAGDTLYYNTNLGAVAAVSARDGRIQWISLYPRVRRGDLLELAPHWSRDLTPCLVDRGRLLVAPADSPRVFALDAATGQVLWQSGPEVADAVDLVGAVGDRLIAAGARVYWIATEGSDRGKVRHVFPDGPEKLGHGRGVLAVGRLYWPARESIYVFDQLTGRQLKVIPLRPRGVTGGNLLVAGGRLLIANEKALIALTGDAPAGKPDGDVAGSLLPHAGEGEDEPGGSPLPHAGEGLRVRAFALPRLLVRRPQLGSSEGPSCAECSAREAELRERVFPSWSLGTR